MEAERKRTTRHGQLSAPTVHIVKLTGETAHQAVRLQDPTDPPCVFRCQSSELFAAMQVPPHCQLTQTPPDRGVQPMHSTTPQGAREVGLGRHAGFPRHLVESFFTNPHGNANQFPRHCGVHRDPWARSRDQAGFVVEVARSGGAITPCMVAQTNFLCTPSRSGMGCTPRPGGVCEK